MIKTRQRKIVVEKKHSVSPNRSHDYRAKITSTRLYTEFLGQGLGQQTSVQHWPNLQTDNSST